MTMVRIKKQQRILGEARDRIRAQIARKYERGMSIRALAAETGRSYGFIHRIVTESDVPMRARGGTVTQGDKPTGRPCPPGDRARTRYDAIE